MINIRKRGKVYQYCFGAGKVNGKRKQISILIDSGIISWDSAIEPISLNDINKDIKDFKHLIYESWEKLYVYKLY